MLTLNLPFPPSSNTMYRNFRGRMVLSPQGRSYKQAVADIVADSKSRIEGRLSLFIAIASPTKRKFDLDNRIKPIQDALQDAGVFDDDEQIDSIQVIRHQPMKGGLCRVIITKEVA